MLLIVVFAATLRVWQWALGHSFWLDEQLIALNIRRYSLAELAGEQDNGTGAPLGWAWLERLILVLFGEGERAMRLPSLVFGVAILVVAWWIGRRWLGQLGGAALVTMLAVNPSMVIYSEQLKHYSADVLWVLLLLTLAGLVVEEPKSRRWIFGFWAVAAIGLWLSMGALLIVPGLALVLGCQALFRHGWRATLPHLPSGLGCAASFLLHYVLSLRHTVGNSYLTSVWSSIGYPPDGIGLRPTYHWFRDQLPILGENPVGLIDPGISGLFWWLVLAGVLVAIWHRVEFGLLLAVSLASAVLFSLLHLVPLAVRLALWVVPVLFIAAACCVSAGAALIGHAWHERVNLPWWKTGMRLGAGALAAAALLIAVPMAQQTSAILSQDRDLDDRGAIKWMIDQHRPGDLVLLVSGAGRAAAWFDSEGRLNPTQSVVSVPAGPECDPQALSRATAGYKRVLAYAGVRYMPYTETYQVLRNRLAELGEIKQTQHFGKLGLVYVVELSGRPAPATPGDCINVWPAVDTRA